jgi:peptidoglycan L-alanyl-D-glutamate endopeptidase CwlK
MARYGKNSLLKLNGVHPSLLLVMMEAINDTPIDFSIVYGVRTTAEQQALYTQGRTKKGAIVTYADGVKNKSNHQIKEDGYGHAIDFCPYVNGKLDWDNISNFEKIVKHIKETANKLGVKITCGIDWKKPFDPPHVQLG